MPRHDFVAEFVAFAKSDGIVDEHGAKRLEVLIRAEYGGQSVKIRQKAPISRSEIDAELRKGRAVAEIAGELCVNRRTVYRYLTSKK